MAEMFWAISDDFWDALAWDQTINELRLAIADNHGNTYKYTQKKTKLKRLKAFAMFIYQGNSSSSFYHIFHNCLHEITVFSATLSADETRCKHSETPA